MNYIPYINRKFAEYRIPYYLEFHVSENYPCFLNHVTNIQNKIGNNLYKSKTKQIHYSHLK